MNVKLVLFFYFLSYAKTIHSWRPSTICTCKCSRYRHSQKNIILEMVKEEESFDLIGSY